MGKVVIYGASDDCIEVEGDIREEWYSYGVEATAWVDALVFSDGSVVQVEYDRHGVWRAGLRRMGSALATRDIAPNDDEDNYSDRLTLSQDEPFAWVVRCRIEAEDER